jgi:hypothetical protein
MGDNPIWTVDPSGRKNVIIDVQEDIDIVLKENDETFAVIGIREIVAQFANERPQVDVTIAGWNLDGTEGETAKISVYWPAS